MKDVMIYNRDGSVATSLYKGSYYKVPTILGCPVVLPSHIDRGTDGETSCHYHVDYRFEWPGFDNPRQVDYDKKILYGPAEVFGYNNYLKPPTILDNGQPITYEILECNNVYANPTGSIFESLCLLYWQLGTLESKDGYCVHHHTKLNQTGNCLTCPAHGMKFRKNGSPRYKAPFFLKFGDCNAQIIPLDMNEVMKIDMKEFHRVLNLRLIDSRQSVIATTTYEIPRGKGQHVINLKIWPTNAYSAPFQILPESCRT